MHPPHIIINLKTNMTVLLKEWSLHGERLFKLRIKKLNMFSPRDLIQVSGLKAILSSAETLVTKSKLDRRQLTSEASR